MEIAAATALATSAAAYVDAKWHIRKDLRILRARSATRAAVARAAEEGRVSPYYFIQANATQPSHYGQPPQREAIWCRQGSFDWPSVLERSNQWGQWFLRQGVKPGDLVGFYMLNSPDFVFAWVGLWSVGAAPAMINYHLTGRALVHCLGLSGAKLVLMDGDETPMGRIAEVKEEMEARGVRFAVRKAVRPEVDLMPGEKPADHLRAKVKTLDPFALFYTSGTTGMPKGCHLPVAAAFAGGISTKLGSNPVKGADQRFYVCMPFYHGTGGINAMTQLLAGTTLCMAPRFSSSNFWQDIRDSRATWFVYVGETLRYLLAAPPSPLDKQHHVHTVYGNGLRPDVWDRVKERFGITTVVEFFNSTEGMLALDNVSSNDFTAKAVGHHGLLMRWKYHEYYVPVAIDPETRELVRNPKTGFAVRMPYDVGGEILVKIPFERSFPGYWNNPEATAKMYVRDVFKKGDCYYRTGDALRRDNDGRWYFLDRLGDTFRWKGENVSTTEVSEVLGKYPGILEANVYGVELPGHDGKAGAAAIYIDPAIGDAFNHEDFLRHARAQLPKYAVPMFVRHIDTPSATHNNKQNKVPLKQEGVHPEKVRGDKLLWIDKHGKGSTYVPFTMKDWEDLTAGRAKL